MRRVRGLIIGTAVAALALLATGCGSSAKDLLFVRDNAGSASQSQQAPPSQVWGVQPGDALGPSALVASAATEAVGVATLGTDGRVQQNGLGTDWMGEALLGYAGTDAAKVTAGSPGDTQTELASGQQAQSVVTQRGAFIVTDSGCKLASDTDKAETVGSGSCSLSDDNRWVLSWPTSGGTLKIKDLRDGSTHTVPDLKVSGAAALGKDARVLAIAESGQRVRGVVLDATTGKVIGQTAEYDRMQVVPPNSSSEGFLVSVLSGQESKLLFVGTDGKPQTIDSGPAVVPVQYGHDVVYVRLEQDAEAGSVRSWAPGEKPKILLRGNVGAGSVSNDHFVATRETDGRVEFYRDDPDGMKRILTLHTSTSRPVSVDRLLVSDSTALLQLTSSNGLSFVRLDMDGSNSVVGVRNWGYLVLEAVDSDGTVLLTGAPKADSSGAPTGGERVLVMGPNDTHPVERASAQRTGTNLIHDGVVYFTSVAGDGTPGVISVNAAGDKDLKVLYRNHQLAGASWPEQGGMFNSVLINRALLTQSQQSQQSQSDQTQSDQSSAG